MVLTRVTSSSLFTGLLIKSSVPQSMPRSMSPSSFRAVTIMTGMSAVCGLFFILLSFGMLVGTLCEGEYPNRMV